MNSITRWRGAFLIFAASVTTAQESRSLPFDVELLEFNSPLSAQALDAQLTSPKVYVAAHYRSPEKIQDVTGRDEPKLPWGRYGPPREQTS